MRDLVSVYNKDLARRLKRSDASFPLEGKLAKKLNYFAKSFPIQGYPKIHQNVLLDEPLHDKLFSSILEEKLATQQAILAILKQPRGGVHSQIYTKLILQYFECKENISKLIKALKTLDEIFNIAKHTDTYSLQTAIEKLEFIAKPLIK